MPTVRVKGDAKSPTGRKVSVRPDPELKPEPAKKKLVDRKNTRKSQIQTPIEVNVEAPEPRIASSALPSRVSNSLSSIQSPPPYVQPAGGLTVKPQLVLTPKQLEGNKLLGGPYRHIMLVGGARSGKTLLICRAIIIRAAMYPNSRHAILRFRHNAVRQSVWLDTLPKTLRLGFPQLRVEFKERDQYIKFPNGSEIWTAGLDDKERVEKILGMEFSSIFFNECSQIPYHSVTVAGTRLAQKIEGLTNRQYYDLNPVGKFHWTYRLFILHKFPDSMASVDNPDEYAMMYLNPRDNVANIDPGFLKSLAAMPEKYRLRFMEGQYVDQFDNALWSLDIIENTRVAPNDVPKLRRIVVSVDPSGASGEIGESSDAIGIIVAGLAEDTDDIYILEDSTGHYSPEAWGKLSVNLFDRYQADHIIAEKNFGGDMVRAVIQGSRAGVPVHLVTASRGKTVRAEPVSARYEQRKVHHVGHFPELEDEMCGFTAAGYMGSRSPNRADALVWGVTDLCERTGVLGWLELVAAAERNYKENQFSPAAAWDAAVNDPGPVTRLVTEPGNLIAPAAVRSGVCPACEAICITRVAGGQYRCNQCGIQFGQPNVYLANVSRADLSL